MDEFSPIKLQRGRVLFMWAPLCQGWSKAPWDSYSTQCCTSNCNGIALESIYLDSHYVAYQRPVLL